MTDVLRSPSRATAASTAIATALLPLPAHAFDMDQDGPGLVHALLLTEDEGSAGDVDLARLGSHLLEVRHVHRVAGVAGVLQLLYLIARSRRD